MNMKLAITAYVEPNNIDSGYLEVVRLERVPGELLHIISVIKKQESRTNIVHYFGESDDILILNTNHTHSLADSNNNHDKHNNNNKFVIQRNAREGTTISNGYQEIKIFRNNQGVKYSSLGGV